ncbi:MAG: YdbH domain-containing protein [Bdellovibrionales bacterium]|nr:YdbH domain-containing protein [Bdellovibrionales bacterium]
MKISRRIKLFLLTPLLLALAAVVTGHVLMQRFIPHWLEGKIESTLFENGLEAKAIVSDFSTGGLTLSVTVQKPVFIRLPSIRIQRLKWTAFRVFFKSGETSLTFKSGREELELLPKNLEINGFFDLKKNVAHINSAEMELGVLHPFLSSLRLSFGGDFERPSGTLRLEVPAQRLQSVVLASPALFCWNIQGDEKLETITANPCTSKTSFKVVFPKIPVFRVDLKNQPFHYQKTRASTSGEIHFANEGANGKLTYRIEKSIKELAFSGNSEAHLGITSLRRTLKRFNIHNTDLKNTDLRLQFDVRIPVSKRMPIFTRSSFEADIPEGTIRGLDLRGFLLRTAVVCSGKPEDFSHPLRACKFDSVNPSLLIEATRIGKLQPIRDVRLVLSDQGTGSFESSWQGAQINSSIQDFSVKSLASTTGLVKIEAKNLSLYELLRAVDRPDLSGKGALEGHANIRWNTENGLAAGLWIEPAQLTATAPGVLSYGTTVSANPIETLKEFQSLLQQGQQALVLRALEDFHYRTLDAQISRNPKSLLRVELKLAGKNPTLARGQPFEIHIPIEGNLEGLILNTMMRDFSNIPRDE